MNLFQIYLCFSSLFRLQEMGIFCMWKISWIFSLSKPKLEMLQKMWKNVCSCSTGISIMLLRPSLVSYKPVCFGSGLDIQDTHMEKYKASMPLICQWDQLNSCSPNHVVDCHAKSRAHLGCWCSPSLQLLVAGLLNALYSRTLAFCLLTYHLLC